MVSSCSLLPGTGYQAVVYYQVQGVKLLFTTRYGCPAVVYYQVQGVKLLFTTRYRVSSCSLLPGTGCPAPVYYQVQGVQINMEIERRPYNLQLSSWWSCEPRISKCSLLFSFQNIEKFKSFFQLIFEETFCLVLLSFV